MLVNPLFTLGYVPGRGPLPSPRDTLRRTGRLTTFMPLTCGNVGQGLFLVAFWSQAHHRASAPDPFNASASRSPCRFRSEICIGLPLPHLGAASSFVPVAADIWGRELFFDDPSAPC